MILTLTNEDTKSKVTKILQDLMNADNFCVVDTHYNIVESFFVLKYESEEYNSEYYWKVQICKIVDTWLTIDTWGKDCDVTYWDSKDKALEYFERCYKEADEEFNELPSDIQINFVIERNIFKSNEENMNNSLQEALKT